MLDFTGFRLVYVEFTYHSYHYLRQYVKGGVTMTYGLSASEMPTITETALFLRVAYLAQDLKRIHRLEDGLEFGDLEGLLPLGGTGSKFVSVLFAQMMREVLNPVPETEYFLPWFGAPQSIVVDTCLAQLGHSPDCKCGGGCSKVRRMWGAMQHLEREELICRVSDTKQLYIAMSRALLDTMLRTAEEFIAVLKTA